MKTRQLKLDEGTTDDGPASTESVSMVRPRRESDSDRAKGDCPVSTGASSLVHPRVELGLDWLREFKTGDRKTAFREFVSCYQRHVHSVLSRKLGPEPHVEDVKVLAQQTMVKAYRALPRFEMDGRAKLSTWVGTIAKNLANDWWRQPERRCHLVPLDEAGPLPDERTPESVASNREIRRMIDAAVQALPGDQRTAVIMAHYEGRSMDEIGGELKIKQGSVRHKLYEARQQLRKALKTLKEE